MEEKRKEEKKRRKEIAPLVPACFRSTPHCPLVEDETTYCRCDRADSNMLPKKHDCTGYRNQGNKTRNKAGEEKKELTTRSECSYSSSCVRCVIPTWTFENQYC